MKDMTLVIIVCLVAVAYIMTEQRPKVAKNTNKNANTHLLKVAVLNEAAKKGPHTLKQIQQYMRENGL